jgi:hypothetical protein
MMDEKKLAEAVAKTLYERDLDGNNSGYEDLTDYVLLHYRGLAEAAIKAIARELPNAPWPCGDNAARCHESKFYRQLKAMGE